MKKILILLSVLLIGCVNRKDVTITGTLNGGEGTGLILQQLEGTRIRDLDSIGLRNNPAFKFRINLENPELLILKNDKGRIINLLPSPGEKIRIEANYNAFSTEYEIEGSPESEKIQSLVIHLADTRRRLDSIANVLNTLPDTENNQAEILRNAYKQTYVNQKRFNIRFIIENIQSLSSIYALYQKLNNDVYILNEVNDLQYFKFVADSMQAYYPNSSLTVSLVEDIALREEQFREDMRMEALLANADEKSILDLALPDINGDTIELSGLKNKVVLIMFWSSGNTGSVKSLLSLQGTYKKYHPRGFEVYAISLDNMRSQWLSSVNFNQFDWINVSELSYPDSRADKLYNVTKLPTSFLINREGELVSRDLFGRNLEIWLDNLL